MGAEHSSEAKKKEDEKYQRMMKYALEQQRKMYEQKCKELLQEQQKTKANEKLNQRNEPTNSTTVMQTPAPYAPLYPNLQQSPLTVKTQPSMSSAYYNAGASSSTPQPLQNKPLLPQTDHSMNANFSHNVASMPTTSYNPRVINTPAFNKQDSSASLDCQPSAPKAPEASAISKWTNKAQAKTQKNYIYQCPSCKSNCIGGNIFQCQKGHSSCKKCKDRAVKCGICRSTITDIRNIELERMIANLQPTDTAKNTERVNCPNKTDGCSLSFMTENLQAHLNECIFREMECPIASAKYSECFWRGKINQVPAHFLEYHPNQTGANVDTEMCFEKFNNNYVLRHIALGNFNFLLHVKLDSNLQFFFMTIQLIGSLVSASKWSYELHIYDKSEPRRKFTYADVCLPTSISFDDVTKETKCAALPLSYALSFFKDNKNLANELIPDDELLALPPSVERRHLYVADYK